jgi:hypothetical protein
VGDYFRAAEARGLAFLLVPAALRANAAWWQNINGPRQNLHNASCQVAVLTVEVNTLSLFTASRKTKNISRISFAC